MNPVGFVLWTSPLVLPVEDPQQIGVVVRPDTHRRADPEPAPRGSQVLQERKGKICLGMYAAARVGEGRKHSYRLSASGPSLFGFPLLPVPFVNQLAQGALLPRQHDPVRARLAWNVAVIILLNET